jgi:hypothetical protein
MRQASNPEQRKMLDQCFQPKCMIELASKLGLNETLSSDANTLLEYSAKYLLSRLAEAAVSATLRRSNGGRGAVMDRSDIEFARVGQSPDVGRPAAAQPSHEHVDRMSMYKAFRELRK